MSRHFDHERLSADEFSAGLDQADLSPIEFQRLTGAGHNTVMSWLKPAGHPKAQEPPFWVTTWLSLYLLPGGPDRARAVAESKLLRDDDDTA
jgi:hypothetical protein